MSDVFSDEERSRVMSKVGNEDTDIEILVRKALWRRGIRYRVNVKDILGNPDICHKGKKIAIFLDGCFWHGCPVCEESPQENSEFWQEKFEKNKERRKEVKIELQDRHWEVMEFWGHEIKQNLDNVIEKIEGKWRSESN